MKRFLLATHGVTLHGVIFFWLTAFVTVDARAQSPTAEDTEQPVANEPVRADGKQHLLRYQFTLGETVRWKVTHEATTETRIQGNSQSSKSRSVSTKVWHVDSIDDDGNISFTHSVESVNMWQELSDRPKVGYDSTKDTTVPREYEQVAKTVGVPLTSVTISSEGKLIDRKSSLGQPNFGLGDIVMLLPPKPVKAGSKWTEPAEIQIREANQQVKRIKIRKLYTLKKVQTGVATIEIKTEVLTPIHDASVKAQLVQQIADGTVRFDVDAGRVISRRMDWDESVIGFSGDDSLMEYLARFTEELLSDEARTARK
jgi:hypothetical protein